MNEYVNMAMSIYYRIHLSVHIYYRIWSPIVYIHEYLSLVLFAYPGTYNFAPQGTDMFAPQGTYMFAPQGTYIFAPQGTYMYEYMEPRCIYTDVIGASFHIHLSIHISMNISSPIVYIYCIYV